jgi:hypothetical protein
MTKICSKCGIEKDESKFYKDKNKKDGLQNSCKKCNSRQKPKEVLPEGKKRCSKCKMEKDVSEFHKDKSRKDGLCNRCKECVKRYMEDNKEHITKKKKQYRKNNVEKITKYQKQYDKDNAENKKKYRKDNAKKIIKYRKQYKKDNAEKIRQATNQYHKYKLLNDEQYKMSYLLRSRLWHAIKDNSKLGSAVRDLDCSIEYLLVKMRADLGREPTKDDQIDHIIPFHLLDMSKKSHQQFVCHYTNLRWLPAKENLSRDYTDLLDFPELYNRYLDLLQNRQ